MLAGRAPLAWAGRFLLAVSALGVAPVVSAQGNAEAVPALALSCTMESPESYRNHVIAVTISEQDKAATVQGRAVKEVIVEYLRFVLVEEKTRWQIDRGTGRVSMFLTSSAAAPSLYGTGSCQVITNRKF